jgi:hypothetical protein
MNVIASQGGTQGLVRQFRDADLAGDVQLLGGVRTIQTFLEIGAIDELDVCLLPVLLGKGIPLFDIEPTDYSNEAWTTLLVGQSEPARHPLYRLERHHVFPEGAIELVFRKEGCRRSRRDNGRQISVPGAGHRHHHARQRRRPVRRDARQPGRPGHSADPRHDRIDAGLER